MTDHANELRRYAKKLDGAPCSGDTRTVMRLAAAHIVELERRLRESEARVTARIDEAVEAEREACAKVCDDATLTITEAAIIGDERRDAGINACTNLAKRIRARANQPTKGG